uniref:Uncharacterized protein n=1 Tax=Caenorhabditis japonica TaxID=281687 RepID=A0A8R1IF88_CAEJA
MRITETETEKQLFFHGNGKGNGKQFFIPRKRKRKFRLSLVYTTDAHIHQPPGGRSSAARSELLCKCAPPK